MALRNLSAFETSIWVIALLTPSVVLTIQYLYLGEIKSYMIFLQGIQLFLLAVQSFKFSNWSSKLRVLWLVLLMGFFDFVMAFCLDEIRQRLQYLFEAAFVVLGALILLQDSTLDGEGEPEIYLEVP